MNILAAPKGTTHVACESIMFPFFKELSANIKLQWLDGEWQSMMNNPKMVHIDDIPAVVTHIADDKTMWYLSRHGLWYKHDGIAKLEQSQPSRGLTLIPIHGGECIVYADKEFDVNPGGKCSIATLANQCAVFNMQYAHMKKIPVSTLHDLRAALDDAEANYE